MIPVTHPRFHSVSGERIALSERASIRSPHCVKDSSLRIRSRALCSFSAIVPGLPSKSSPMTAEAIGCACAVFRGEPFGGGRTQTILSTRSRLRNWLCCSTMVCLIAPTSLMNGGASIPPFSLRRLALAPLLPPPREGNSTAKTPQGSVAPPPCCASASANIPRDLRY
jgi:hypothetical protein